MAGPMDYAGASALASLMAGVGATAGHPLAGFGPTGIMPDTAAAFAMAPGAPPPGGGFVPNVAASSGGGGVSPNPIQAPPRAPPSGFPHAPAPDAPAPPPPSPLQLLQALRAAPYGAHYLSEVADDLRTAFFTKIGAPPTATVQQITAIPVARMERDLDGIVLGTSPIPSFQVGLLLEPFLKARSDLESLSAPPRQEVPPSLSPPGAPMMVQMAPDDPHLVPFSKILCPTFTGTFAMLPSATLTHIRQTFGNILGGLGPDEVERPTDRQLSGLSAWLTSAPFGRPRAPKVCFSLWGAYGNVTFENLTFVPRERLADGTWQPVRFKGPGDYPAWRKCWAVYESAMIMLGAASPASLKTYRTGIRKLAEAFPQFWPRIYVADVQLRANMWDRLLEQRLASKEVTLETPMIWDGIIRDSAWGGLGVAGPLSGWWVENCWMPCLSAAANITAPAPEPAPQHVYQAINYRTGQGHQQTDNHPINPHTGASRNGGQHQRSGGKGNQQQQQHQTRQQNHAVCLNCGDQHHWWNCTRLTGKALSRDLEQLAAGKGDAQPKKKAKGAPKGGRDQKGKGNGKDKGKREQEREATPEIQELEESRPNRRENGRRNHGGRRRSD